MMNISLGFTTLTSTPENLYAHNNCLSSQYTQFAEAPSSKLFTQPYGRSYLAFTLLALISYVCYYQTRVTK